MNYNKITVPCLGNAKIEEIVEQFRAKFYNNTVPVDIEYIIEIKMKISIWPIPDFLKHTGTDALITSDWTTIYVDRNEYMDERFLNRLRFSLAHEIAHLVLHKTIYESFGITNHSDYQRLYEDIPQEKYGYLETQANKFANYLLVPRQVLKIAAKKELIKSEENLKKIIKEGLEISKKLSNINGKDIEKAYKNIDRETLNSYMAIPLSSIFNVSEDVIAIALNDIGPL